MLKKLQYKFTIVILFLIYALFITKLPSNEILLGGDWSFPTTKTQLNEWLYSMHYTWYGLNFGARSIGQSSLYLAYLENLLTYFISPNLFISSLVVLSLSFMGINLYKLLKFLNIKSLPSFLGSVTYISSPIVFNYTIMGWIYVLMAMALLPLAILYFIKSIEEKNILYLFLSSLLVTLAIQSQTIIWFFILITILSFYIINKNNIFIFIKYYFIFILFFALLNSYYLLNLFLLPSQAVISSNIVSSDVSIGAASYFYPLNTLRLFGSMFNYQYEFIIEVSTILSIISFLGIMIILFAFFITKYKKLYLTFITIATIPIVLYFLNFNRELLNYIPFANVIRDFGRFTVLTTFAYSILFAISIEFIIAQKNKTINLLTIIIIFLYFLSLYPWYSGKLLSWEENLGQHQRLRTKVFSNDYYVVEKILSKDKDDIKAIFLPFSSNIDFEDDKKFHGMFQEAQDVFAMYSPIKGHFILNDRNLGYSDEFVRVLDKNLANDFLNLLSLSNSKYIVFRKNLKLNNKKEIMNYLEEEVKNRKIKTLYNGEDITLYEINNHLPHIYATTKFPQIIDKLDTIEKLKFDTPFIIKSQNKNINALINKLNNTNISNPPKIKFQKINPTKYRVKIHNAKENFMLNFLESFHELWKVYLVPIDENNNIFYETLKYKEILKNTHLLLNGYANSWVINPNELCNNNNLCIENRDNSYNFNLIIEFYPQIYFYIGIILTLFTILIFIYLFIKEIYKNTHKEGNNL